MSLAERVLIHSVAWYGGASSEPLTGDLIEEFRSGRSLWWLLKESCAAIAGYLLTDLRASKLHAIRAVGIGLVVVMPLAAFTRRFPLPHWADGPLTLWALSCLAFAAAGMAIAHTFPKRPAAMVSAFTFYALFAKLCLLAFNAPRFFGDTPPVRDGVLAPAILIAPLCSIAGALLLGRWKEGRA